MLSSFGMTNLALQYSGISVYLCWKLDGSLNGMVAPVVTWAQYTSSMSSIADQSVRLDCCSTDMTTGRYRNASIVTLVAGMLGSPWIQRRQQRTKHQIYIFCFRFARWSHTKCFKSTLLQHNFRLWAGSNQWWNVQTCVQSVGRKNFQFPKEIPVH